MRRSRARGRSPFALCGALAACIALAGSAPALAAREVGYPALLAQIRSGPVIRAVINHAGGDIEIKFRDLSEWKASFPPGAQPMLQRLLHERHIRVIFASRHRAHAPRAPVHHHLRYIAAGVLGAIALTAVLAFAVRRRHHGRGEHATAAPPG